MRFSKLFCYTFKEEPSHSESASHSLLLRGDFIKQIAAGVYVYQPLMTRVLAKVSDIIRKEMDRAGAQEVIMPVLQTRDLWEESGRWETYMRSGIMFHLADRKGQEMCLGPTHEEVITDLVRRGVKSYKQLPLILYQVQVKFRDEFRPRFGIVRGREFMMKDAYSFDIDEAGMERSYQAMKEAYVRALKRCGLKFVIVEADPGDIGGSASEEFMVSTPSGEDVLFACSSCSYAANSERAEVKHIPAKNEEMKLIHLEETPDIRTVDQLSDFFNLDRAKMAKTILYLADGKPTGVLIRGDREINEVKLKRLLGVGSIEMADAETIMRLTAADVGFTGPVGLKGVQIVADESVRGLRNFLCGANVNDKHFLDANYGRDFPEPEFADLSIAQDGDLCGRCSSGILESKRCMEAGHLFRLGTKYSKSMNATFTDQNGAEKHFLMGCYGFGVSRIPAIIVEQNHDENGMHWPPAVAPYQFNVIIVNMGDPSQVELAEMLYEKMQGAGIEVLLDDRQMQAGFKFKDSDLIGIPYKIIVGRAAKDAKIEFKERKAKEVEVLTESEVISRAKEIIKKSLNGAG